MEYFSNLHRTSQFGNQLIATRKHTEKETDPLQYEHQHHACETSHNQRIPPQSQQNEISIASLAVHESLFTRSFCSYTRIPTPSLEVTFNCRKHGIGISRSARRGTRSAAPRRSGKQFQREPVRKLAEKVGLGRNFPVFPLVAIHDRTEKS